jgi:hypothetical protein
MAEEGFVQMYVHDFATLASRAEAGVDVEAALRKRVGETRSHAELMDSRKEPGHLAAVAERLKLEARKSTPANMRHSEDPDARARREAFLMRVADLLHADPPKAEALPGDARRWSKGFA